MKAYERIQYIGSLCLLLMLSELASAVPVAGRFFNVVQSDGTPISVFIRGDEHVQIIESPEGYTLVRDRDTKDYCYAVLSADGSTLLSSGIRAEKSPAGLKLSKHLRPLRSRIQKAPGDEEPSLVSKVKPAEGLTNFETGAVRGICLLVDFPDQPAEIAPAEIEAFCNQPGYTGYGNNGSVRDYFYEVSGRRLDYSNTIVQRYYTAQHNKAYYDQGYIGAAARELILEALNDLEKQGFDFSGYDSNQDGRIDVINCMYAGTSIPGEGLWPHAASFGGTEFMADGVSASGYQISYIGEGPQLGIFCHETGHVLFGWPDLYDTDYESLGIGAYCLMSYGCQGPWGKNPVEPCAYLKYRCGWVDVFSLETYQADLSLLNNGLIYKYDNPSNDAEYYLLENRHLSGRDALLPDGGLALWHIDEEGRNTRQQRTWQSHYEVTLMQADGRWDLEMNQNLGDSEDLWSAPDFTIFGPYSNTVQTAWWNGALSGLGVKDIGPAAEIMPFSFQLDPLEIISSPACHFAGNPGGPFYPPQAEFAVMNTALEPLEAVISVHEDWLFLQDTQGQHGGQLEIFLEPGEVYEFVAYTNGTAYQLPEGYYYDSVIFGNQTTGIEQERFVDLDIREDLRVLLQTDFQNGLPVGWQVEDGTEDGMTWRFGELALSSSTLLESPYAYIDRIYWPSPAMAQEALVTPAVDCSVMDTISLEFSHHLMLYIPEATRARVEVSVDSGPWWTVADLDTTANEVRRISIPEAAGQEQVRFRWYYEAPLADGYWCIDNIVVRGRCSVLWPADMNGDCRVNMDDLAMLTSAWMDGSCSYSNAWCYGSDLNRSGDVNLLDFLDLSRQW